MIIVSACLAGINCAYDGQSRICKKVVELLKSGKAIPVCPEQLGGLTTPRLPAEIKNDCVIRNDGKDVTKNFEKGALEALKIAQLVGCKKAIFKAKSPSCGKGKIYDGNFISKLIDGNGITTKLFLENSIEVISEIEL